MLSKSQAIARESYNEKEVSFDPSKLKIFSEDEIVQQSQKSDTFLEENNFVVIPKDSYKGNYENLSDASFKVITDNLKTGARIGLKVGSLYVEYEPTGNGGFEAKAWEINFVSNETKSLFNFKREKNDAPFRFEDLFPFSLRTFSTNIGETKLADENLRKKADVIKIQLAQIAKGNPIDLSVFKKTYADFLQEGKFKEIGIAEQAEKKEDKNEEPQKAAPADLQAIADELYTIGIEEGGFSADDMKTSIAKYITAVKKSIIVDTDFVKELLETVPMPEKGNKGKGLKLKSLILEEIPEEIVSAFKNEEKKPTVSEKPKLIVLMRKKEIQTQESNLEQKLIAEGMEHLRKLLNNSFNNPLNKVGVAFSGLFSNENIANMSALQGVVNENKKYATYEQFYSAVKPLIDGIKENKFMDKRIGTNELYDALQEFKKQAEKQLEIKQQRDVPRKGSQQP